MYTSIRTRKHRGRLNRRIAIILISTVACLVTLCSALADGETPVLPMEEKKIPDRAQIKYEGQGVRDPFMSLLTIKKEDRSKVIPPPPLEERPPGLPGLLISEVTVSGIAAGKDKEIVVLKGIDEVSYIAEPGTALFDGVLERIDQEGVVFSRKEQTSDGKTKTFLVTKPFFSSEKQVLP